MKEDRKWSPSVSATYLLDQLTRRLSWITVPMWVRPRRVPGVIPIGVPMYFGGEATNFTSWVPARGIMLPLQYTSTHLPILTAMKFGGPNVDSSLRLGG